jgi:hypothetical protein
VDDAHPLRSRSPAACRLPPAACRLPQWMIGVT